MSEFDSVDVTEVERIIQHLPVKTSPLDIIPTNIMKQCQTEFATAISNIANLSFRAGRFPANMKNGWVTPLLKKAGLDIADMKNFRPITNLSTVSKIVERLALSRLKPLIMSSPNFGQLQSAYRQGHSTESALNKILDDLLSDVDHGSVVAVVSLDISAAFDAVEHDVLVQRLEDEFGVSGVCRQWIISYLTGRSSMVHVDTSASPTTGATCGVP